MKLSKQTLKTIILEELEGLLEGGYGSGMKLTPQQLRQRQRQRDEADIKARRKVAYQGGRELMGLAHGIAEEEEQCSVGNPNHSKDDGTFVSSDKAGSWAINTKGSQCKHGQYSKKYKGKDTSVCGRANQYKSCATGKIKEDQLEDPLPTDSTGNQEDDYQALHYEHAKLKLSYKKLNNAHEQLLQQMKKAKTLLADHGMSWADCLNQVNRSALASKGDLKKPAKK